MDPSSEWVRRLKIAFGPGRQIVLSGSGLLAQGLGCIAYLEVYETTGTASAQVTFYDGSVNNGIVLADYTLLPSQSTSEQWVRHQMPFVEGIYFTVVSGTVAGSLTAWAGHACEEDLNWERRAARLKWLETEAQLLALGAG